MVAIFCQFSKSSHFSNISCFYDPFYAQNSSNVPVEPLLACFSQFCLTQSDQFCHSSKSSYFLNISCFSKPFYPYRTSNVLVEPFLACFSQFYCDPNWPFCKDYSLCIGAIFRTLYSLIFRILAGFSSCSLHRPAPMCLLSRFSHAFPNFKG